MRGPMLLDRRSSFEGCLLGVMVGDSLGALVENASPGLVASRYGSPRERRALRPGPYGSTTEMTVALAESLAADAEFDGEHFASRLLERCHESRIYGQGTSIALAQLDAGAPWNEAAATAVGRACYGNAAAARSAPVGLAYARDLALLRWVAEEAAVVTHAHALAAEGAVAFAHGVALAHVGRGRRLDGSIFFETIAREAQMREFRAHLEIAAGLLDKPWRPETVVSRLGNNQTTLGSVVTALLCFARHADDLVEAVTAALGLGGNATSIVAMTAALAGAHRGRAAIPPDWIAGLEAGEITSATLVGVADALLDVD